LIKELQAKIVILTKDKTKENKREEEDLLDVIAQIQKLEKQTKPKQNQIDLFAKDTFLDDLYVDLENKDFFEEFVDPVYEYEEHLMNEICPNPDQMTYEQLLELQEKVGFVSKGASKELVEQLPTSKFHGTTDANKSSSCCNICLNDFEEGDDIRSLPCFHFFHRQEIDKWLAQKDSCPVCLTPATKTTTPTPS